MSLLRRLFGACLLAQMALAVEVPRLKLNNGLEIPQIALGTYLGFDANGVVEPTAEFSDMIAKAIDIGWRHFDSASIYKTEKALGEGIRRKIDDGTVKRSDVFITTKLWNTHHKKEQVLEALRNTLDEMGLEYVDLFLMHWPIGLNADNSASTTDYMETWRGMEEAVTLGLVKSIGLSNFNIQQLNRVVAEGNIKPAVLQVEIHLQMVQSDLVKQAQAQGLVVMGYSPLGSLVMRHGFDFPGPKMDNPILRELAKKYGKTVPQIVLRWLVDRQIVPIAKTTKVKRLEENINIFDFTLAVEDQEKLNAFNSNTRYTLPSFWQEHPYYPFEKISNPIPDPFRKN